MWQIHSLLVSAEYISSLNKLKPLVRLQFKWASVADRHAIWTKAPQLITVQQNETLRFPNVALQIFTSPNLWLYPWHEAIKEQLPLLSTSARFFLSDSNSDLYFRAILSHSENIWKRSNVLRATVERTVYPEWPRILLLVNYKETNFLFILLQQDFIAVTKL